MAMISIVIMFFIIVIFHVFHIANEDFLFRHDMHTSSCYMNLDIINPIVFKNVFRLVSSTLLFRNIYHLAMLALFIFAYPYFKNNLIGITHFLPLLGDMGN